MKLYIHNYSPNAQRIGLKWLHIANETSWTAIHGVDGYTQQGRLKDYSPEGEHL